MMKKKWIYVIGLILLFLVVIKISNPQSQLTSKDIFAGNQYIFDSKMRVTITQNLIDEFNAKMSIEGYQLGLNRIYKDNSGNIFVSLAIDPSYPQFYTKLSIDRKNEIIDKQSIIEKNTQYHCFLIKRKELYITRLVYYESKLNNLIVIDRPIIDIAEAKKSFKNIRQLFPGTK